MWGRAYHYALGSMTATLALPLFTGLTIFCGREKITSSVICGTEFHFLQMFLSILYWGCQGRNTSQEKEEEQTRGL